MIQRTRFTGVRYVGIEKEARGKGQGRLGRSTTSPLFDYLAAQAAAVVFDNALLLQRLNEHKARVDSGNVFERKSLS